MQDNKDATENPLKKIFFIVVFFISFLQTYFCNASVWFIIIYHAAFNEELLNSDWLYIVLNVIPYFKNLQNRYELSIAEEYDKVCISDCLLCVSFANNSSMSR